MSKDTDYKTLEIPSLKVDIPLTLIREQERADGGRYFVSGKLFGVSFREEINHDDYVVLETALNKERQKGHSDVKPTLSGNLEFELKFPLGN